MAVTKYTGGHTALSTDYHAIKWVGQTKGGKSVTIEMTFAICISNLDLTFAEKDDVVPEVEFEACYAEQSNGVFADEPWSITLADGVTAGSGEIVLGAGLFYIDNNLVGLTRGGGSFTREIELREINADGDPGKVKDRVVLESARPKLKMNMLQWLTRINLVTVGLKTAT